MIYWCDSCNIPIINRKTCSICEYGVREVSKDIRPVFAIEKIFISIILEDDITDKSVWNKHSIYYIIDGEDISVSYSDLYNDVQKRESLYREYSFYIKKIYEELNINQYEWAMQDSYMQRFIEANNEYMKLLEFEAHSYIRKIVEKYRENYIETVSFSGGKDSIVVSSLVRDALNNQKVLHLFGDTTLEFPTTYEFIERFQRDNIYTPFIISSSDKDFFELCRYEFGPPSRHERWCCTIFKSGPIGENINILGESYRSISFMGIRAQESGERRDYNRTQFNSKISSQIAAMPILEWSNADVWLYILYKGLDFNAAYNMGFTRVGCWCCPNNSSRSNLLLYLNFNDLHTDWRDLLIDYAKAAEIEDYDVYVDHGYWKARRGMKGLEKKNTKLRSVVCNTYDDAKIYFINDGLDGTLMELFKPFGEVMTKFLGNDVSIYSIKGKELEMDIELYNKGGMIKIIPKATNDIRLLYQRVECQIRKFEFCIGCSACDNICPNRAIDTTNGYRIHEDKCIHCLKCIAKYNGGCLRVEKHKSKV